MLVLTVLLYLFAFEPAHVGRQKLEQELPRLRGALAQIEGLAAEARRLNALPAPGAESPQQVKVQLEQSVASAGLSGALSQIAVAGELIDVRFKAVSFAAWLDWFDAALRETRLRAVDVAIERETTPGQVSVRLTLEVPKREP
jgi:type II secretory pathway component PulM